jgi:hypothetical protein
MFGTSVAEPELHQLPEPEPPLDVTPARNFYLKEK